MIAIKGQVYGDPHQCLEDFEDIGMAAIQRFDPKLADALGLIKSDQKRWKTCISRGGSSHPTLSMTTSHPDLHVMHSMKKTDEEPFKGANGNFLPYHVMDFWTNLAMCHSLIVEENPKAGGLPIYQVRVRSPSYSFTEYWFFELCLVYIMQDSISLKLRLCIGLVSG